MKSSLSAIRNKIIQRYTLEDKDNLTTKSTNINVLLNRVELDKKRESRKKILFTAVTSVGVILFGVLIF